MSSVILLAIVLAWGVVLVPMLLRRHETVSETRSVERFATAMRVLSRRTPSAGREFVMPERPESQPTVHVKGSAEPPESAGSGSDDTAVHSRLRRTRDWSEPAAEERYDRPPAPYAASRRVVVRRRRMLLVLIAVAALQVAGILLVGPGFWIGQGLCDLLIVGYLVHVRRDVARARNRRARLAERLVADRVAETARRESRSGYAAAAEPPAHLAEAARAMAETREVVIEKAADGSWHPVPVPPPTYVTAPPAPPRREQAAAAAAARAAMDGPVVGEEGFDGLADYGQRVVND